MFIEEIVKGLGGVDNIAALDACITRLRITVKDATLVIDDDKWKKLYAQGIIRSGDGIQIIYGTKAEEYKNAIKEAYNF